MMRKAASPLEPVPALQPPSVVPGSLPSLPEPPPDPPPLPLPEPLPVPQPVPPPVPPPVPLPAPQPCCCAIGVTVSSAVSLIAGSMLVSRQPVQVVAMVLPLVALTSRYLSVLPAVPTNGLATV